MPYIKNRVIAIILMIAIIISNVGMSTLAVSISHYVVYATNNMKDNSDITYRYHERQTMLLMNDSADETDIDNNNQDEQSQPDNQEKHDNQEKPDNQEKHDNQDDIEDINETTKPSELEQSEKSEEFEETGEHKESLDNEHDENLDEEQDEEIGENGEKYENEHEDNHDEGHDEGHNEKFDKEHAEDHDKGFDEVDEIATPSEYEEKDEISTLSEISTKTKKNNNLFGADPHVHKACGISGDTACRHTLGDIHTSTISYVPVGSYTNFNDFVQGIKSASSGAEGYIYLTESLSLSSSLSERYRIDMTLYICLNGKSLICEYFDVENNSNIKIYITNCKEATGNIVLVSGQTVGNTYNLFVYGVNKNIEFDNSSVSWKSRFIQISWNDSFDYMFYDVSVHHYIDDSSDSGMIKLYTLMTGRCNFSMEDVDFTMNVTGRNYFSFIEITNNESYDAYYITLNIKNLNLDAGNVEHVQFCKGTPKTTINFSGTNTFNNLSVDGFNTPTGFISNGSVNIIDGITKFTNINNYTGGAIIDDCTLDINKEATMEISSNLIKFLPDTDQYVVKAKSSNLRGTLMVINNSFYGAQAVDTNIRTGCFYSGTSGSDLKISSEKVAFSNTSIYTSNDGTGEKFNDNMWIYDFYINTIYENNNGFIRLNASEKFNKESTFGTIGLSMITQDKSELNFPLFISWNKERTEVEDIDAVDDYFLLGKTKNEKAFINRTTNRLSICIHNSHKICGRDSNSSCNHNLVSPHTESVDYAAVGQTSVAQFKANIEQGNSTSKYYYLQKDMKSSGITTITLNADLYLCLYGHLLENIVFKANNSSNVRRNIYLCNCDGMPSPTIRCYEDSFVSDLGLDAYGINVSNQTVFDVKTLASFHGKNFGNNNVSINMYSVKITNEGLNANYGKLVSNVISSSNNEYQNIDIGFETVYFENYTTTGLFARNVYVTNQDVRYNRITVFGNNDLFTMSDEGELKFVNNGNQIYRCKATSSEVFFKVNVPVTISSGILDIGYNELRGSMAEGLVNSVSGITIEEGAELRFNYNIILNNDKTQYIYSVSANDRIKGNLTIRNNRYISNVDTDESVNASLLLPDAVSLNIGSGKILVTNNQAYRVNNANDNGVGSALDTLHIYEVYSEMSQLTTPIIKVMDSASFNTDNRFSGITFKNNAGFGRVISDFNYGSSVYNTSFIVDNYYYKTHRLLYSNGNVDIKGYTYTIKFHVNNANNDSYEQVSTSSVATKFIANKFDYEGYLFLGWATVSNVVPKSPNFKVDYKDGYDKFLYDTTQDGKIIDLYGVWFNLNTKYNVGFNMHGHGIQIATMSVTYDSLLDGLASPSELGYSFDGWYRDAGYNSLWNLGSDKVNDNITLHAKWTEITYTITYHTNGGKYADNYSAPVSRKYFDAVTLPTSSNVKREGYTFVGWYENSNFSGLAVTNIPANTEGNKVYYLKWTENEYTITLNKNGGTYANGYTEPKSRKYSEAVTLPTSENITKTGNIFIGWYDNDSFSGTKVLNIASNSEGNKVFYLKWEPVKYTIRYNADGGTIATTSVIKAYGENLTLATPSKLGYAFDGWYSDVALTNLYDGKSDLKDTEGGEVNIYAKYRYSKYRVIYTSSDASVTGGPITQECTYDTQYNAIHISEFTKTNWTNQYYRFVDSVPSGYYPTRSRLYSEQDFVNLVGIDGVDLIYEPIFTMISNEDTDPDPSKTPEDHAEQTKDNEEFIVTYFRNIDDSDIASVSVVYPYNVMALTERAKNLHLIYEGHKCHGWALESDKNTIKYHEHDEVFYEADANPEKDNNINLYAVWGENGYNVVFSSSGLSGVTGHNQTYELTFKEKATSPAEDNFLKSNSKFAYYEYAYATVDDLAYTYTPKRERIYASREFSELATVEDIELIYKPHFTTISNNNTDPGKTPEEHNRQTEENETFVITYFANNDTDTKVEETYRYDTESYTLENTFVKEGHHFMGWTDDPNKTSVLYNEKEEIFFKIENDDNNNINLYAVWEENKYKVVWTSDGDTDISGVDRTVELKFSQKGTAPVETAFTKADSNFAYYEYFKIEPTSSTNYNISRERLYKSQEFSKLVDIHNVTLYFKPVFTTISNETTDPGKTEEEHNEQTKENETFVFTYYANDGTENKKIVTYNYNTMSLVENKIFNRKNYEFLGWNEDKNATTGDDEYQPGKELFKKVENDANNNKELYAIWRTFEYTITFSANGQENVTGADISITSGFEEQKNAPNSTAFSRNNDRFAYYEYVSTTVEGEASNKKPKRLRLYANQAYIDLSEVNRAVYLFRAVFTNDGEVDNSETEEKFKRLHYEIRYHANDGSKNVITQIATYNEITFIKNNDFKRSGYSFGGYSTNQNSNTVSFKNGDEVFVKVEEDRILNLYAVWNKTGNNQNGGNNNNGGGSRGGGSGGGGGGLPGGSTQKIVPSYWVFDYNTNKYTVYGQNSQVLVGWVYTNGFNNRVGWFYFTQYGTPISGWFFDMDNETYYFDSEFVMVTGNIQIDGIIRKFDISGALRDNLISADNKSVNNKGVWTYEPITNEWQYWVIQDNNTIALLRNSWFKSNMSGLDEYYAVDKDGAFITGFVKFKGAYYYLEENGFTKGILVSNTTIDINGVSVTFDEFGRITSDITQIEQNAKIYDMSEDTQTNNAEYVANLAGKSYVKLYNNIFKY